MFKRFYFRILADIVSENFFGGFKEKSDQDNKKNRKDWIEEMIAKSKQAKVRIEKKNMLPIFFRNSAT